ncbi:MAG: IclR family transcriptional regulator [Devosia sp.]|nr:IclR family transcriptional regulator [Devosia sp.]
MNEQGTVSASVVSGGNRERGIDRVLTLFAYLNGRGRPVRVADLPKALGAPRSTIYEIVRVLTEAGMLEVSGDDNRVYFGRAMYLYGINYFRDNELIRRGSSEVEALSKMTGETSELCVLNRNRQAIIHTHPGSRPMRISSEVGSQFPIPWTASGRLLLSHMTPAEIRDLIEPEDLVLPDRRVVDIEGFIVECLAARGKSIVITRGLINSFSQCLAVPILGMHGEVQATICFVLPIDVTDEQRAVLQEHLIASGRKLSMHE